MNPSGPAALSSEAPPQNRSEKYAAVGLSRSVSVWLALLLIGTAAVYFPVRSHPFFNPDDWVYVTGNNHVQAGLTWATVVWSFQSHVINWHPLTWISHAVDFGLFGLNPTGHHLMNVAFHLLNAVLLCWVLQRATGRSGCSFMVAALFALHPINVEPVVWIAERKTLLSTTFFLLALGAYRWYVERPRETRFWVMAGLFVAALLAKPQVIAFPFLLLLWDYWPLNRYSTDEDLPPWGVSKKHFYGLVKEKLPLFFFAGADALMTLTSQGVTDHAYRTYPLALRLENAVVAYATYVGKAFWPLHLVSYYPHAGYFLPAWQVTASLGLLTVITGAVLYYWRERYLAVGWFWFLGTMVPMIGIVQVGNQALADRYAYQPFIGLYVMVCWGVAQAWLKLRLPTRLLQACSAMALAALIVLTYRQVGFWKDDFTLWSHCLDVTGDNVIIEYNLGNSQLNAGVPGDEYVVHFRKALALANHPQDPYVVASLMPYIQLKMAWYEHESRNFAGAIQYYKNALEESDQPRARKAAYLGMAAAYRGLRDANNATKCESEAARIMIDPDRP